MIHRSLLPIVHGFPEEVDLKALEDYALWLRTTTQTAFAFVNEPLVTYLDTPNSSIRADSKNGWVQRRHVFNNFLQWAQPQFVTNKCVDYALYMYDEAMKIIFNN